MAMVGGVKEKGASENNIEIDNLAKSAVDEDNKEENAMLEFQKVVKLKEQVVSGIVYYITLEATQGSENKEDYQNYHEAKIWVNPWLNFKELLDFKYLGIALN